MPKRFTDSAKWSKVWFGDLSPALKCFWSYVVDNCSTGGVWEPNWKRASFDIGATLDVAEVKEKFKKQFIEIDEGRKWFIVDFISFQYGHLSPTNPAHRGAVAELQRYGLLASDCSVSLPSNNSRAPAEELQSPSQGTKDRATDKAKAAATGMEVDKAKAKTKATVPEVLPSDFGAFLAAQWGRDGSEIPWAVKCEFVQLAQKHGWERVQYAVTQAAKYNKRSLAYVAGILEPKNKSVESQKLFDANLAELAKQNGVSTRGTT